jgi:hypothetical protein
VRSGKSGTFQLFRLALAGLVDPELVGGSSLSFFLEVANLIAVLYLHENGSNPRALGRVIMWATPSRDYSGVLKD